MVRFIREAIRLKIIVSNQKRLENTKLKNGTKLKLEFKYLWPTPRSQRAVK